MLITSPGLEQRQPATHPSAALERIGAMPADCWLRFSANLHPDGQAGGMPGRVSAWIS